MVYECVCCSPVINNPFSTMTYGGEACLHQDAERRRGLVDPNAPGGCVPAYRTAYTYVYNIVTRAWFGSGALCIGRCAMISANSMFRYLLRSSARM